jgi:hypothetical protein
VTRAADRMDRDELLRVERDRWNEFDRLVRCVPSDRLDEPTLNPDGWSVKDLLWHMGSWDDEIADQLERIRAGTYTEHGWDEDPMNARYLEEGRRSDARSARELCSRARERVRAEMDLQPDLTAAVEDLFSESAYKHMDDHLPELRRFVEGPADR